MLLYSLSARGAPSKKIWETHECEKFWFGYDVTSVRTQSHNSNALMFVWREVAWRDAFTTEMLKNTKYKVNLYVLLDILTAGKVEKSLHLAISPVRYQLW